MLSHFTSFDLLGTAMCHRTSSDIFRHRGVRKKAARKIEDSNKTSLVLRGGKPMATIKNKIVPHLWFDKEAKEAAMFYTSVFKNSRIKRTTTLHDTPSGTVDIVTFELLGQEFMAISAGPLFKFNESISFIVRCETQKEIDYYWKNLTGSGGQEIQCGWLKDKYGLSWQIVPTSMDKMMKSKDPMRLAMVTQAFLKMKKFDIAALQKAYDGK
jgi:predicted 3-demethylubiquinone-9 3-methyltransferase (glyoxalase superfamily)